MPTYTVQQGDCLSSIARQSNMLPDTIWNAPENADLVKQRKSKNILLPDDELFIPDPKQKQIPCATDKRHKFVLKGAKCKLRVRFRIIDPSGKETKLSNEAFSLDLDRKIVNGNTDGAGGIRQSIDPAAKNGVITVLKRKFPFQLGALDPHDSITGIQARLNQCGYNAGPIDGDFGPRSQAAFNKFQKDNNLPITTGSPDQATINALEKTYGA